MNRPCKRDKFIDGLDTLRQFVELNNTEFAQILGVKRQAWVRWKNGHQGLQLRSCWKLVKKLSEHFKIELKLADFLGITCPRCRKQMFLCKIGGCEDDYGSTKDRKEER